MRNAPHLSSQACVRTEYAYKTALPFKRWVPICNTSLPSFISLIRGESILSLEATPPQPVLTCSQRKRLAPSLLSPLPAYFPLLKTQEASCLPRLQGPHGGGLAIVWALEARSGPLPRGLPALPLTPRRTRGEPGPGVHSAWPLPSVWNAVPLFSHPPVGPKCSTNLYFLLA